MLEAPALLARRVGALIDPSGAPTATKPGACSSPCPGCTPGVLPAMSSGTAGAAVAHAGATSRHGSTTSPPLARRQPTLTRVAALTFIYTAHNSHSRHRLTLADRFHSTARAPADTFLVPARSPRKTRPSRRPPRSARPLVRPTSFMRTTTPRSPPAKALRAMSRLRCAQSLHCTNAGKRPPAACRSSLPRGRVWPPRHDRLCLPTLLRVACPRHAAMLSV